MRIIDVKAIDTVAQQMETINAEKVESVVPVIEPEDVVGSGEVAFFAKIESIEKVKTPHVQHLKTEHPVIIATKVSYNNNVNKNKTSYNIARVENSLGEMVYQPNVQNVRKAISKLAVYIRQFLGKKNVYDKIQSYFNKNNLTANMIYTRIQSSIFYSLREFLNIPDSDEKYQIDADFKYLNTLVFLDRIYNDRNVSYEKNSEQLMVKYVDTYNDCKGIELEWINIVKRLLHEKLEIHEDGINIIIDTIKETWCQDDIIVHDIMSSQQDIIPDEEDIQEEFVDDNNYMRVEIFDDDTSSIIKIMSSDVHGPTAIPFYVDLDKVNPKCSIPSFIDDRNDNWDWLIHMIPDLMFKTQDPDKYLAINDNDAIEDISSGGFLRAVIMDKNNNEYTMGLHYIEGIYNIDDDGNETLNLDEDIIGKINTLVKTTISSGEVSHLERSLSMTDLIREEEYILNHLLISYEDDSEENDDLPEEEHEENLSYDNSAQSEDTNVWSDVSEEGPDNEEDNSSLDEYIASEIFGSNSVDNFDEELEDIGSFDELSDSEVEEMLSVNSTPNSTSSTVNDFMRIENGQIILTPQSRN